MDPRVSVVVPVYNGEAFLAETLSSILTQTFEDFELLLIDDGSVDRSAAIIAEHCDPRIRLVRNAENLGIGATMNKGLSLARGVYVARCDQDDLCRPERLARQVDFLDRRPEVTLLGGAMEMFGMAHETTGFPPDDAQIKARLLSGRFCLANPTTMVRSDDLRRMGARYGPSRSGADDYEFWVDLAERGARFANLEEVVLDWRYHGGNTSLRPDLAHQYLCDLVGARQRIVARYFPDLTSGEAQVLAAGFQLETLLQKPLETTARFLAAAATAASSRQSDCGQDQRLVSDLIHAEVDLTVDQLIKRGQLRADHLEFARAAWPVLADALTPRA